MAKMLPITDNPPPKDKDILTWAPHGGYAVAALHSHPGGDYWLPTGNVEAYDLDMSAPTHWSELPPEEDLK